MNTLMPTFDLNLIRTLVTLYETRSVTQAAERMDITQPSVSHALARLRILFSDPLFTRTAKGLVPTPLCDHLYPALRDALTTIEGTLVSSRSFDPLTSNRRFTMALSDIGTMYFIPPLLKRLQAKASGIEVDVIQPTADLSHLLLTGKVDFAIGNMPELVSQTRSKKLFEERYVCLVARNHPDIKERMSKAQFARARHVMVTSPSSGHALIDQVCTEQGIVRRVVARIPQFTALPNLIASSDLVVVLPSRVASVFVRQAPLKTVPLALPIPSFEVRIHWQSRHESQAGFQWMLRTITDTIGSL